MCVWKPGGGLCVCGGQTGAVKNTDLNLGKPQNYLDPMNFTETVCNFLSF